MASGSINRYRSFCSSLKALEEAKYRDASDSFVLSGTVQKFSLTFDISWKVMKDILVKHHGILDFAVGSPRETLKTAASVRLIGDDLWLEMLHTRNALTHDYNGELAASCFSVIVDTYIPLFQKFQAEAEKYMETIA